MATATSMSAQGVINAYDVVAASADDSPLVAAAGTKRIRVLSVVLNHGDTTASSVTFLSKGSGGGTAIAPLLKGPPNGGFVLPYNERGWFSTVRGEGLSVDTSTGSNTAIIVTYDLIA